MTISDKRSYQAMKRKHEIEGFRIAFSEIIDLYEIDGLEVPPRENIDSLITMHNKRLKEAISNIFET